MNAETTAQREDATTAGSPIKHPSIQAVYLSGPMTGLPEFNYPAFFAAARVLRRVGYTVYNPAEFARIDTTGMTGTDFTDPRLAGFDLRSAFADYTGFISTLADAIAVLPGWVGSKGARAEVALGIAIGLPVIDALTGDLLDPTFTVEGAPTTDAAQPSSPKPLARAFPAPPLTLVDPRAHGGMIRQMTDPYRSRSADPASSPAPAPAAATPVDSSAPAERPAVTGAQLPEGAPLLIGLAGYAQTGKDTTALALGRLYGYRQVSPSDILREFLYAQDIAIPADRRGLFGSRFGARLMTRLLGQRAISLNALVDEHGWEIARRIHPYIRGLQQRTGTEAGRNVIDENIWADAVMRRMSDGGAYVSTSVRFLNEAEDIVKRGGVIIRIHRPGVEAVNAHPSDTIMDGWDYGEDIIVNSGSLEDLEVEVARAIERIAARRRQIAA